MATVNQTPAKTLQDPRLKEILQELRKTDNFVNIFYFLRVYLVLGVVIGGTIWFYHQNTFLGLGWWWNVPLTLLTIVLVGAGQHQLTGLAHEAAHHILFKNRLGNDLAADWLCMFPLFSSTQHYRLQHLAHHQFVNDPQRDPDISQLQTSGHWLDFPLAQRVFRATMLRQLWVPNLIRYMSIRARYNAIPTDKNPYLKKGWRPRKATVRVGIVYLAVLVPLLTALVWLEDPWLLALLRLGLYAAVMVFYAVIPETMFHQSRVHPVISMRAMSLGRITFITGLFYGLAWLSLLVDSWAAGYYILLWIVPIFTSFSFFMILRQIVQHGNGGRGWLTNTRVFFVNRLISFAVFPIGQDYHLPHHLFASVPHYRLRRLHQVLLDFPEYRAQAVEVDGYFHPRQRPSTRPTVVDVLGPDYARRDPEVYIDNTVLEQERVEDKDDILQQGTVSAQDESPSSRP